MRLWSSNHTIGPLFAGFFFLCIMACEQQESVKTSRTPGEENVQPKMDRVPPKKEKKPVTYSIDTLADQKAVDSFQTRFNPDEKKVIFALNRMDAYRLNAGDVLIIPDSVSGDLMDYSPFPMTMRLLDSIPKAVLINKRIQAFGLYEQGELIRWGPVNSGKKSTPTPSGLFYGNYKARKKISTVDPDWLMPYYFNFMNFEGVGVHQYAMPGYPASHACVRLYQEDAVYIYNWADQWKLDDREQVVLQNGTPFMVFGVYLFEEEKPWLDLAEDPRANFLQPAEKDTLHSYVTRYFEDPRNFDSVPGTQNAFSSSEEGVTP